MKSSIDASARPSAWRLLTEVDIVFRHTHSISPTISSRMSSIVTVPNAKLIDNVILCSAERNSWSIRSTRLSSVMTTAVRNTFVHASAFGIAAMQRQQSGHQNSSIPFIFAITEKREGGLDDKYQDIRPASGCVLGNHLGSGS
ncbi:hypothetical protein KCP75_02330 [Salmonella enterica subsp. enterica]|nr:hypothetical protein KCP75_02330 [Salmonella enterica subsp. enterica]